MHVQTFVEHADLGNHLGEVAHLWNEDGYLEATGPIGPGSSIDDFVTGRWYIVIGDQIELVYPEPTRVLG